MEDQSIKSKGEKMVRIDFNIDENNIVHTIKENSARLIDLIETIRDKDPRLAALAQTAFEEGAMWAVKLATVKE